MGLCKRLYDSIGTDPRRDPFRRPAPPPPAPPPKRPEAPTQRSLFDDDTREDRPVYHELTLAPGDAIRLGPDIRLTLDPTRPSPTLARLGISAPRSVPITRPEADPTRYARPAAKEATP